MVSADDAPITAEFDWRQEGPQTWDIEIQSAGDMLRLSKGGAELYLNDRPLVSGTDREYSGIYERFAMLIRAGQSDADYQPLRIVADAFLRGARQDVDPFTE
jgi:D-galactose 1-dehydrogenase